MTSKTSNFPVAVCGGGGGRGEGVSSTVDDLSNVANVLVCNIFYFRFLLTVRKMSNCSLL
jgi:hypothetical protein